MYNKISSPIITGCFFALILISSCKKNDSVTANGAVTIESFTPAQGGGTTEILITGSNFSTDTSQIAVSINGKPLKIIGANDHQIMAVIPTKAGSGPIVVTKHGQTATSSASFTYVYNHIVTTLAGNGTAGYANGNGADAEFHFTGYRSMGIVVDSSLNVYVDDVGNNCIRKIDSAGNVTLFTGTPGVWGYGDGGPGVSKYALPYGLAIDASGNIYSADPVNYDLRKITPDGTTTTIGWGAGAPWGITVDPSSGAIYYTAQDAGVVYRLNADGSSTAIASGLSYPADIACDSHGNVYVSVNGEQVIRKLAAGTWESSVIAGTAGTAGYVDGPGASAQFSYPWGLGIDGLDNIYVAGNGTYNGSTSNADQAIRCIVAGTWEVSTFAGSSTAGFANGMGSAASFSAPTDVAVDKNGTLYVIDANNNAIRKIVSQ